MNKPATVDEVAPIRKEIDGYLIGDLETMLQTTEPTGLGYPMLLTILLGMELVGTLLSGTDEYAAFSKFFKEFRGDHPTYKGLNEFFRNAIRDKTAHVYLLHGGIQVTKGVPGAHLTRTEDGLVNIDVETFYADFRHTYERLMQEIADGTRFAYGVDKLQDELGELNDQVAKLATTLPPFPEPSTEQAASAAAGALTGAAHAGSATMFTTAASGTRIFPGGH